MSLLSRKRGQHLVAWLLLAGLMIGPVLLAGTSPFLAYRNLEYILAGFAGIVGLAILLIQPLLAAGLVPGLSARSQRRIHQWTGAGLVFAVVVHIGGLYLTSPPDTIDALLLRSPTPFSVFGVIGLCCVLVMGGLVLFRRRLRLTARHWRLLHTLLATLVVVATVVHALQIEGTMERASKWLLSAAVLFAFIFAVSKLWARTLRRAKNFSVSRNT